MASGSDAGSSRPREAESALPAHRRSPLAFQVSYAVGTIIVVLLTTMMVVMSAGPSVTTAAVGALVGAIVGAAYMATVRLIARRE